LYDGRERRVPFGPEDQQSALRELQEVISGLPFGEVVEEPKTLARPDPLGCRWCDVRHRCVAYLEQAPTWRRTGTHENQPPPDCWGRVTQVEQDVDQVDIRLVDESGRSYWVKAIDKRHFGGTIPKAGAELWFFGLQAKPGNGTDGRYIPDPNPWELSVVKSSRRAWSLDVYMGSHSS